MSVGRRRGCRSWRLLPKTQLPTPSRCRRPAVPWPTARPRAVREWTWARWPRCGGRRRSVPVPFSHPCVPRARADVRAQEPSFDRFRSVPNGGRRREAAARHRRRRLKGGGGGSTPAAVARGRRWRTEGGGDPREAAIRGRRWRPEMLSSPPAEDAGQMRSPSRVEETVTEQKETERS